MANEELIPLKPFLPTDWSLVDSAARLGGPEQQNALETLLRQYLPSLKEFLRLQYRCDPAQAEDYLQSFVLEQVLRKEIITHADRTRGKFRTFLLRALSNFVLNEKRNAAAGKRSPPEGLVSFAELSPEDFDQWTEQARHRFDDTFAREVLSLALSRMRAQCAADGREDLWGIFEARILLPAFEQARAATYEELVARFNLQTPAQASNLLITAKRMYVRMLRSVVAEYVDGEDEIAAEIRELQAILAGA